MHKHHGGESYNLNTCRAAPSRNRMWILQHRHVERGQRRKSSRICREKKEVRVSNTKAETAGQRDTLTAGSPPDAPGCKLAGAGTRRAGHPTGRCALTNDIQAWLRPLSPSFRYREPARLCSKKPVLRYVERRDASQRKGCIQSRRSAAFVPIPGVRSVCRNSFCSQAPQNLSFRR